MIRRSRIMALLVAAVTLVVTAPSGTASADEPTAFNPGPPACTTTIWGNVNTRVGVLEFQRPVQELRFGDHVYRLQDRYIAHDADKLIIAGSLRHWMDACSGLPTQQVLMYGKYSTLFLFDGDFAQFQGSTVVRRSGQPWREVRGAINDKYTRSGGPLSRLGVPTTDETRTPTKPGAYNHFDKGASIYWSPGTGAHVVEGAIRQKWSSMGWENGMLGFPLTDEEWGRSSRYNHFQGGSIFWSSSTGAREVHGAIRDRWASVGWERSSLGLPVTDEVRTPNGRGAFNHFQGGSVYWSPSTGARIVKGAIRDKWASLGWGEGLPRLPDGRRVQHAEPPGRSQPLRARLDLLVAGDGRARGPRRHPGHLGTPRVGEQPVRLPADR